MHSLRSRDRLTYFSGGLELAHSPAAEQAMIKSNARRGFTESWRVALERAVDFGGVDWFSPFCRSRIISQYSFKHLGKEEKANRHRTGLSSIVKTVTDEASFGSQMVTRRVDCVKLAMSAMDSTVWWPLLPGPLRHRRWQTAAPAKPRFADKFPRLERLASVGNAQLARANPHCAPSLPDDVFRLCPPAASRNVRGDVA